MCFHDPPRSWSNLQAYPACSLTSRTFSSAHPNSLLRPGHAYPPFLLWTPSLTHPNESTSGELNCSCSACGPPITNSSFATQTKNIPKSYSPSNQNTTTTSIIIPTIRNYQPNHLKQYTQLDFSPFSLKPWVLAQNSTPASLKPHHLA